MNHCQNCKAMVNPKWTECLSCGCSLKAGRYHMTMDSAILGAGIHVELHPDQATVDGVTYQNNELKDLLSRGFAADEIRAVHEVKGTFDGEVKP